MNGTKDIGEGRLLTGNGKMAIGYNKATGIDGRGDIGADNRI